MRHSEIKVGGYYLARMRGRMAVVRVDGIEAKAEGKQGNRLRKEGYKYRVTNPLTSLTGQFWSSRKFLEEVPAALVIRS